MKVRWDELFNDTKNGANIVYINKPSQLKPTSNYLAKFSNAVGKSVKNFTDVCV